MVRHFQELFDVRRLEGVYPQMTRVYQQLHEASNVMKHLKVALDLGESPQLAMAHDRGMEWLHPPSVYLPNMR